MGILSMLRVKLSILCFGYLEKALAWICDRQLAKYLTHLDEEFKT